MRTHLELGARRPPFASPLALVGVPYVRGGVTPAAGFDCYTLMSYVRWHWYQRTTPINGVPDNRSTSEACATGITCALNLGRELVPVWQAHTTPLEGCAVALGRSRFDRLHHCGVWAEGGVLHAYVSLGVVWVPGERVHEEFKRVEFYELCDRAQNRI